ncbi:uncharacterized protein A4U43_C05F30370 [Asparagus officinalis]|uniref:DNA topoisomerase I n=1 Tax=Asparagus officinalis TaxID=4686 RepID=A0A5P1F050_ASPOF|nr:uncharacterized protein A4U43_C05F30370 [Asparagus officinalis]
MAVDGHVKPVFHDNSDVIDDDDAPVVFRRTSAASKKNQLNSASKKPSSQKPEETRGRPIESQSACNGESSSLHKNKVTSTANVSTEKSGAVCSNFGASVPSQSNHSSRNRSSSSGAKSLHTNTCDEVEDSDDSDDDKPLSSRFNTASVALQKAYSIDHQKVAQGSLENKARGEGADKMILDKSCPRSVVSDDSDDEQPLSARFSSPSGAVQKSNESPVPTSTPSQKIKATSYYSEDEKPLLSRLSKSSVGTTIKKFKSMKKPLATDGSNKTESSDLKPQRGLNRRPLGDINHSTESSSKKAKLSSASVPGKVRDEAVVKNEEKDDDDHIPIGHRIKKVSSSNSQSSIKKVEKTTSSSFKRYSKSFKKDSKAMKKTMKKTMKNSKRSKSIKVPPGSDGGQKWMTLEHNGVIFPPPYKPHGVKMLYNGQPVDLTPEQEEVATMFAVMKDTDYATKPTFIKNFMMDWREILGKKHIIKKFELCDFTPIYEWHLKEKEKKKQMTSEEKKALKEEKLKQEEKYMWAVVDGVKEKVGNFRVEPPGLFRGRGEHPKMGKLKRRIRPRDITINIGKDAPVPECPIPGERWKEIRHDNTVTWLAYWNDPINTKELKYVFLAASSSLKGQSDKDKYEKARLLKDYIEGIRATYTKNFTSKDPTKKQIAVATYLIDKLALRAGNEKDDDEADTVGCCTLKVENVTCVPPNKLQFDFLGKDSIRYFNTVEVEVPVYKAIGEFQTARKSDGKRKAGGDDLFDMLDTSKLNAHLKELMPGLTAKVFRTFNASITLDSMLFEEIKEGTLPEKIAVYQKANKEVAIICNHQRSVSKSHDAQMSRLNEKIGELKEELQVDLSRARKGKPPLKDKDGKPKKNLSPEVLEKKLSQVEAKIEKMELDKTIKEDLKTVALGTSKINYLDPRISVAWCKRNEVPIEKV